MSKNIFLVATIFWIAACGQEPKANDASLKKTLEDSPMTVTQEGEKSVITIDEEKVKKIREERAKRQDEIGRKSAFSDDVSTSKSDLQKAETPVEKRKDSPMTITKENGKTVITIDEDKARKIREERAKRQAEIGRKSAFD